MFPAQKGRKKVLAGIIENGSWAPVSGRIMRAMLEEMKNIEIVDTVVTIKSRMKKTDIASLEQLADAILK